jgi:BioD-like phosphotransacetylase family protein
VPEATKYLLIGSTEGYSGKSALLLGLAQNLQQQGFAISYGKPVGTCFTSESTDSDEELVDEDGRFIAETLNLPADRRYPTLVRLDANEIQRQLRQGGPQDQIARLKQAYAEPQGDLLLIEGSGTLREGLLFGLSLPTMAETLEASVLLVVRWRDDLAVDELLAAKQQLGDRLLGVILNAVPKEQRSLAEEVLSPYLEQLGIPVLGIMPRSPLLRSVSVSELVQRLNAKVLCGRDRLDLMVESLSIGAMNVNSALEYFRKGRNMAVVTGGDRTEIQLAALETSTQCLILTGRITPLPTVLSRAEEMEIPILAVDLDTLTTVEIIDQAFGQVRLQEGVKAQYVVRLIRDYLDLSRLQQLLNLSPTAVLPL